MSSQKIVLLNKHFSSCSAVFAMVTVARVANASIISWAPNTTIPTTNGGMYFNLQTQTTGLSSAAVSGWDLNPYGTSTSELKWYSPLEGGCLVGLGANGVNLGVENFIGLSRTIGPQSIFGVTASSVQNGGWEINAVNIFGFQFKNSAFTTLYGFGGIEIGANMGVRKMLFIQYESDGTPIEFVGLPTPGVMPLLALIGFAKRRRRI